MSAQLRGPVGSPAEAVSRVVVGVLGVIAIRRDQDLIALPGARARLLLAALAVRPGRARGAQALIEEVWGRQPPRAPMNALHTQVSRLRALLPDGALEIGPAGYRLTLPADSIDLTLAADLARRADQRLADHPADSLTEIARARALWRGEPGADLPDSTPAEDLRTAAETVRHRLDHLELAAHTALGDFTTALPLARATAAADPLDESAHTTLIRLLALADRSSEALEVFAAYRLRLIEELGADPGPALLALNTAILRGEPITVARQSVGAPQPGGADALSGPGTGQVRDPAALSDADTRQVRDPAVLSDPGTRQGRDPVASVGSGARESGDPGGSGPRSAVGLRAAPNELLGRGADLAAIAGLTNRSRVTTILGPGGTGKTRVANAVGERLASSVPVALVELASVQAETEGGADARAAVEAAIGQVLGLGEAREPGGLRPGRHIDSGRRLREALAARPMVLILDNCEHVIDAVADLVADLVGGCAHLTVLTTSRSPLSITAESVYPLDPLAIDAAGSPATDLFSARARAVRPDVRLDPELVARLCRTLDGLPLAIELAAARVRTMSVAEIETRLEHRFALLRSGDRSAPHRHRTLHAVIAWSWNLLDPEQQVTLRRLSRFPAGFTLAAAEIVAAGPEVATAVDGLVSQSLLTVLDDPDGAGVRYRMLETVREFGAEQLAEVDARTDGAESALVRDRMAAWACGFTAAAAREFRTGDQVAAVLAVTAELDNLSAVLRHAADRGDAATAYAVFPVVSMVWMMRGAHREFLGWALRLVALEPDEPSSAEDADLQMIAHLMTFLHMQFVDEGGARAVAIVRTRARRLRTYPGLDPALAFLGELITVRPSGWRLGRLFARGTRSPHRFVRLAALFARANFWENGGNIAGSTRDALRALDHLDPTQVWGTAMVCQHLAQLCGQSARYGEAVTYYRRALAPLDRLRVHDEIMEIRCYLASVLVGSGQLEQARAELDFALRPDDAGVGPVDDPAVRRNHRLANAATAIAELELAGGELDAGLGHYRRALELLGWPGFEPTPGPGALMIAAAAVDAHALHGRASDAVDLADRLFASADRRLAQFFDLPQIGAVGCALGSYLLGTGTDPDRGLELLTLATKSSARQDGPSMEVACHLALHRATVGDAAMDEALRRAAGLRRITAARRIIELIADKP
ncbi:AfsR/SARP family transcriptional regulator [Nocardia lasii]|uniref:BTAD domain-containing putative transcriptional regulator n=1 Tax=Nocardia lasii TaxID=1616107 RepID=A0ABW1JW45_9NOCA